MNVLSYADLGAIAPAQGREAREISGVEREVAAHLYGRRTLPPPLDEIDRRAAGMIMDRWGTVCEAAFDFLATSYPHDLLNIIRSQRVRATDLTFAAEAARNVIDSASARSALMPLLKHAEAVVREGALYGLARHVDGEVMAAFRHVASNDSSPAVRTVSSSILEDL